MSAIEASEMRGELQELRATAEKILTALEGDTLGNKGLVARMDHTENKLSKLDRWCKKWFYLGYGAAGACYAGWEWYKFVHK